MYGRAFVFKKAFRFTGGNIKALWTLLYFENLSAVVLQPDIYIGSLRIQEPVVAATSLMVTIVAIVCFYKTRQARHNISISMYRWFVLLTGISTFFGGLLGHAFNYELGFSGKFPSWFISMAAVWLGGQAALIRAKHVLGKKWYQVLTVFNLVELIALLVITIIYQKFIFVEIHSAIGLVLLVFIPEAVLYKRFHSHISLGVMFGIVSLVGAVVFHILKISVTHWFTYFDFGHVFMAMCLVYVCRGILRSYRTEQVTLS